MDSGTMIVPQKIRIARADGSQVEVPNVTLATWKSALRLETKGMKTSRRSCSATVKDYLGLPKNMRVARVLEIVTDLLEQYHTAIGKGA